MPGHLDRRTFLRRAAAAAGWSLAVPLFAACAPTPPPAKPAETKPVDTKPPAPPPAASPPPGASPSPAAAAPAVSKINKLAYGIVSYNPYHIAVIVGAEKPEMLAKHGVELDIVITGSGPNAVAAMVGGSLNMTTAAAEAAWQAQDREPDVKQIIAVANGTPYSLLVNPDIKKIADLKGKALGSSAIRGGADTTAMRALLFENGLKDGDYDIVVVGSVAERTAAMKAGTVMAVAQQEPQTTQMKDAGFVELDNCDNYPALAAVHSVVVIARKSWYEPNMEIAVGLVRGWIEITKWIYDPKNRDELVNIMVKTLKVEQKAANNAYEYWFLKSKTPPPIPLIDMKRMEATADVQRKIGTPNVPTDPAKYVDNRIVERAMSS